jgi:hypothetical protein
MTGPLVTPDRETLVDGLVRHHWSGTTDLCDCGQRVRSDMRGLELAAHQADALLSGAVTTAADAARAWAEDEALVERVWALADKRTTAEVTQILRALAAALGGES